MKLSQTLDKLMSERDVSAYKISKATGISDRLIGYWRKGEKLPGAENLLAIANYFGISVDYLLTGKEKSSPTVELTADERELLDIYNNLSPKSQGRLRERAEVLAELEAPVADKPDQQEPETIFIEYSVCSVSAGTGEPLINDSYPDFIEVKRNEVTEDANFAVKINGNSMLPYYKDNDIVLVRSQPAVEIGEIGIFTIDGSGYIKQLGADRLISLNPKYDDIYFNAEQDIRCKGLVIATLESEDFV